MDTPTGTVNEQPMLFICHTGLDEAYVTDLAAKLEARGIRCWYYERDNNGESIGLAVDKALDESLSLLFVMSENIPETSQYIQNELIEFVRTKRKVIPLRVSMPQTFWPKGSKSLVGAFPVLDDRTGKATDSLIEIIAQKVPGYSPPRNSVNPLSITHGQERIFHWKWQIVNAIVVGLFIVVSVVAIRMNSANSKKHGPPDVPLSDIKKTRKSPKLLKAAKHGNATNSILDVHLPGSISMFFRLCPAGQFIMGGSLSKQGYSKGENQRVVTFDTPFWIGETEVTQSQWYHLMDGQTISDLAAIALSDDTEYFANGTIRKTLGLSKDANPVEMCKGISDETPVYWVSMADAERFCRRLNALELSEGRVPDGFEYRLPTEEEWEYACRAGTVSALPNGLDLDILGDNNCPNLDPVAWYGGNAGVGLEYEGWNMANWREKQYDFIYGDVREIQRKEPNNWGLFDMIGNVWEWCYGRGASNLNTLSVRRGGGWSSLASYCSPSCRIVEKSGTRYHDIGFRVALAPILKDSPSQTNSSVRTSTNAQNAFRP